MNEKKFLGIVAKKKEIYDILDGDIAKYLGISERTYCRRRKNPGDFSVAELFGIMKFLKFSKEEKEEALLA